jgi:hypothetical protein
MKSFQILTIIIAVLLFLNQSISYAEEITEEQALSIAQETFNKIVPEDAGDEYRFFGIEKRSRDYFVRWWRFVNDIPVKDEKVFIYIDVNSGKVLETQLVYGYPSAELNTTPLITSKQATQLALDTYGGKVIDSPTLYIKDKNLLWNVILEFSDKSRIFLGMDAVTGEIKASDSSKGSPTQQVTQSSTPPSSTPPSYQPPLNQQYIVIAIVIITITAICSIIYWKKKEIKAEANHSIIT